MNEKITTYQSNMTEIAILCEKIKAGVFAQLDLDWAHVGDLGRIVDLLKEAEAIIGRKEHE